MKTRTFGAITAAALAMAMAFSSSAQADHHLMQIREVHNGALFNNDYVVLQMYADGQNLTLNHYLDFYDNVGAVQGSHVIDKNVANGQSQRRILFGNPAGVAGADDNSIGNVIVNGPGGAVCFNESALQTGGIDCVTWGNYTGPALPSATGTPAASIAADQSLVRSIARGCSTLLEGADDTNNSAADFAIGTPNPKNNSATPTEKPCTPTKKAKCKKKKKAKGKSAATAKKKCKKKKKGK